MHKACKVSCGEGFTLVIDNKGSVYSFGKGSNGRLGHNSEEHIQFPKRIEGI